MVPIWSPTSSRPDPSVSGTRFSGETKPSATSLRPMPSLVSAAEALPPARTAKHEVRATARERSKKLVFTAPDSSGLPPQSNKTSSFRSIPNRHRTVLRPVNNRPFDHGRKQVYAIVDHNQVGVVARTQQAFLRFADDVRGHKRA